MSINIIRTANGCLQRRAVAHRTSNTFTDLLADVYCYADAQLPVLVDLRVDAAADVGLLAWPALTRDNRPGVSRTR